MIGCLLTTHYRSMKEPLICPLPMQEDISKCIHFSYPQSKWIPFSSNYLLIPLTGMEVDNGSGSRGAFSSCLSAALTVLADLLLNLTLGTTSSSCHRVWLSVCPSADCGTAHLQVSSIGSSWHFVIIFSGYKKIWILCGNKLNLLSGNTAHIFSNLKMKKKTVNNLCASVSFLFFWFHIIWLLLSWPIRFVWWYHHVLWSQLLTLCMCLYHVYSCCLQQGGYVSHVS